MEIEKVENNSNIKSKEIILDPISFDTTQFSTFDKYIQEIEKERYQENLIETIQEDIIDELFYGLYSEKDIRQNSGPQINSLIDEGKHTLNDLKMGTETQLGQPGYITLYKPVYNPYYIKEIANILTSICPCCGSLYLSKDQIEEEVPNDVRGLLRISMISNISKGKNLSCKKCMGEEEVEEGIDPKKLKVHGKNKYSKDELNAILEEYGLEAEKNTLTSKIKKIKEYLKEKENINEQENINEKQKGNINENCLPRNYTSDRDGDIYWKYKIDQPGRFLIEPEDTLKILKLLEEKPEQALLFGLRNPSALVMSAIFVVPPFVRPEAVVSGQQVSHDLTRLYKDVLRANLNTKEQEEDPVGNYKKLREAVTVLFKGSEEVKASQGVKAKKAVKGLLGMIKDKDGLMRGNLMGKRVNFTARSVAGGASAKDQPIGTVGVPLSIARILTKPETVNQFNRNHLQGKLRANKVNKINDSSTHTILNVNPYYAKNYILKIGDIVHRQLQDDDIAIFGRQPTLHKESFVGMPIKIISGKTFRVALPHTSPLNLDFDGDEVTIHVPQSQGAAIEALNVLGIENQLITEASNKPNIGLIFDNLLHLSSVTNQGELLKPYQFNDMVYHATDSFDAVEHRERMNRYGVLYYSGISAFAAISPKDFNYRKSGTVIIDGVIVNGPLKDSDLGRSHGNILQTMIRSHSPRVALDFLDKASKLITVYTDYFPNTIGIPDFIAEDQKELLKFKNNKIEEMKIAILNVKDPDEEQKEKKINEIISKTQDELSEYAYSKVDPFNNMLKFIKSGAKGSDFNFLQVLLNVGQPYSKGERKNMQLAYHTKDINTPETKGYSKSSRLQGSTPSEYMYDMMVAREGMEDTSVKTQLSGTVHRLLVKNLENVKVSKRGPVTNVNGKIIQFQYGYDGFNAQYLVSQTSYNDHQTIAFMDARKEINNININNGYIL